MAKLKDRLKDIKKRRGLSAEIWGVIFGALAALSAVSLVLKHTGSTGWIGLIGNNVSELLFAAIGYSSYVFPFIFALIAFEFLFREGLKARVSIPLSLLLFIIAFSGIFVLLGGEGHLGGIVGSLLTLNLKVYLGPAGTFIVLFAIFLISLRIGTGISLIYLAQKTALLIVAGVVWSWRALVGALSWALEKKRALKETRAETKADRVERKAEQKKEKEKETALKAAKAQAASATARRTKPTIVTARPEKARPAKKAESQEAFSFKEPSGGTPGGEFKLPSLKLLDPLPERQAGVDKDTLLTNSKILEKKLLDFDVEGQVLEVRPGPVVTMYEFEPAPGVKVNKIMNLSDDLALAMRATSIRIIAPIPGKAVVGIEIPNTKREGAFLREILESSQYATSKSKLTLAFGKDISGVSYASDLAKMPHLLIAGATGAGKSVFVNALVLSILFKSTPADVRFLMIDPKMLELSAYEGIPHLLTPVVTESKRGAGMLRGVVTEMEKRYRLMAEVGAKGIERYNELVVEKPTHNDTEHRKLPYIVVVIDELADLMMTSGKDVEDALVRLSQMARASGIHLLVATQRPSVDVITGLIKANFPARVSFQVPSRTDSRTILDSMGAETLLGDGDMLFLPPGTAKLKRLHGAYVSEAEIKRVTEFLKKQGKPTYDQGIAEAKVKAKYGKGGPGGPGGPGGDEYDEEFMERYNEAIRLAEGLEMISTSYIQRRFRIGYNTAARIIEKLEADGIVGPAQGSRPREVIKRGIEG